MELTRGHSLTIRERIEREPEFAEALVSEALVLSREGDTGPARVILRDLLDAIGESEALSNLAAGPRESVQRVMSPLGEPTADDLLAVADAIAAALQERFVGRCMQSIEKTVAAGDGVPAQTVIERLESKLAAARRGTE